jgi:hypothetical protein
VDKCPLCGNDAYFLFPFKVREDDMLFVCKECVRTMEKKIKAIEKRSEPKMKHTRFGHWLKIFDVGRNNVIGRAQGIFSFALQIATYVAVIGITADLTTLIFLIILMGVSTMVTGLVWVRTGVFDSENSSKNLNNPEIMEILKKVEIIEAKLSGGNYNER